VDLAEFQARVPAQGLAEERGLGLLLLRFLLLGHVAPRFGSSMKAGWRSARFDGAGPLCRARACRRSISRARATIDPGFPDRVPAEGRTWRAGSIRSILSSPRQRVKRLL